MTQNLNDSFFEIPSVIDEKELNFNEDTNEFDFDFEDPSSFDFNPEELSLKDSKNEEKTQKNIKNDQKEHKNDQKSDSRRKNPMDKINSKKDVEEANFNDFNLKHSADIFDDLDYGEDLFLKKKVVNKKEKVPEKKEKRKFEKVISKEQNYVNKKKEFNNESKVRKNDLLRKDNINNEKRANNLRKEKSNKRRKVENVQSSQIYLDLDAKGKFSEKELEKIIEISQREMDKISESLSNIEIEAKEKISLAVNNFVSNILKEYNRFGMECQEKIKKLYDLKNQIKSTNEKTKKIYDLFTRMGKMPPICNK